MPKRKKFYGNPVPTFNACPSGHALPHKTQGGECTPLYCALPDGNATKAIWAAEKEGDRKGVEKRVFKQIDERMLTNEYRLKLRRQFFKAPTSTLEGGEAEAWAQKRLIELMPDAVIRIEERLKHGDDQESYEAAKDVLDRAGMSRREAASMSGPVLIINTGGAPLELPWLKRTKPIGGTDVPPPENQR